MENEGDCNNRRGLEDGVRVKRTKLREMRLIEVERMRLVEVCGRRLRGQSLAESRIRGQDLLRVRGPGWLILRSQTLVKSGLSV